MKRLILAGLMVLALAAPSHAADIEKALIVVFGHEGGLQCDSNDPGNWTSGRVGVGRKGCTKYGIATNTYPKEDIRNMTRKRAAYLYKRDFWNPLMLDDIKSQGIATEIFDTAVNCGVGTAANIVAKSCNFLYRPFPPFPVNGKMSMQVVNFINVYTEKKSNRVVFWKVLNVLQGQRYLQIAENNPKMKRYLNSWFARVGG